MYLLNIIEVKDPAGNFESSSEAEHAGPGPGARQKSYLTYLILAFLHFSWQQWSVSNKLLTADPLLTGMGGARTRPFSSGFHEKYFYQRWLANWFTSAALGPFIMVAY